MDRETLAHLSKDDLIELVLATGSADRGAGQTGGGAGGKAGTAAEDPGQLQPAALARRQAEPDVARQAEAQGTPRQLPRALPGAGSRARIVRRR
jgi:hypothetical protein